MEQQQNPISERVERDVRLLIGDLQIQLIIMKNTLDLTKEVMSAGQVKPNGDANATRQSSAAQSDVRSGPRQVHSGNSQESSEGVRSR